MKQGSAQTIPDRRVFLPGRETTLPSICIFFLTFPQNNLIYESRCDLYEVANLMLRENQSMKNATKKAAKKKAAPKKKGK